MSTATITTETQKAIDAAPLRSIIRCNRWGENAVASLIKIAAGELLLVKQNGRALKQRPVFKSIQEFQLRLPTAVDVQYSITPPPAAAPAAPVKLNLKDAHGQIKAAPTRSIVRLTDSSGDRFTLLKMPDSKILLLKINGAKQVGAKNYKNIFEFASVNAPADGVNRISSMTLEVPAAARTAAPTPSAAQPALSDLERLQHLYKSNRMVPRELSYRNSVREEMLVLSKDQVAELEKEQPNWETVRANNEAISGFQYLLDTTPHLANLPGRFVLGAAGSASTKYLALNGEPLLLVQVREEDRARAGYDYAIYYAGRVGQSFEELGIHDTRDLLLSNKGRQTTARL
jgi:hypothetical protein